MRIELFTAPGCPNADAARTLLNDRLAKLGITAPIVDHIGRYPSPTVLVEGIDVMRQEQTCRSATRADSTCRQRSASSMRCAPSRKQIESHSNDALDD